MSRPEPNLEDEIFERLRRGDINLRQAYRLFDQLEAGQHPKELAPVESAPAKPGRPGLLTRLRIQGRGRPDLRVIKPVEEEPPPAPAPVKPIVGIGLETGAILAFLLVLGVLAGPLLFKSGYAPGFDVPSHMYIAQRLGDSLKTTGHLPKIDLLWYSGLEITHKLPPIAYAPLVALYLLTNSAMAASRIFYVLALGTMGLIMYLVVRLSGYGRLNGLGAAIVVPFSMAGVSYDNGVLLSYTRYFAFLLFPLALYSGKRLVEGRLTHTVYLAVLISLMFPSHPMIGLIAAMWIGVYALARIVLEHRAILSFRYFVYAYALAAFMAFWYIGPFVAEEPVWGAAIPPQTLLENSTTLIYQAVHLEIALAFMVIAVMVYRYSAERLALLLASFFGFAYAWGAYGPILKYLPQLEFAYPFLSFFASVIGLTYLVFTSANLSDIRETGRNVALKRGGAAAIVMALVAAVLFQNYRHDPFTKFKTSDFSADEKLISAKLRKEPKSGRVMPLGEPYGRIVHALPLLAHKPSAEGQYTTIAPFYLEVTQIYDNLEKGYPDTALEKLKRWNTNYVLVNPNLKETKDFRGRDLKRLLGEEGFKTILTTRAWTAYKRLRPSKAIQGVPGNTLVVGRFAPVVSALFPPAIGAQKSFAIDDYKLSDLDAFKTLVLYGWTFNDKAAAEKLLKDYVAGGGHLVIDMQSVDISALGPDRKFLGVKVKPVELSGATSLTVRSGGGLDLSRLRPISFPRHWRTIEYADLTGSSITTNIHKRQSSAALLGYKRVGNHNVFFTGGNLLFFAFDQHNAELAGALGDLFAGLRETKPGGPIKITPRLSAPTKVAFSYRAKTAWPVLISRTYTPHWRALLDGRRPLTVNKMEGLTEVELPSGDHRVTLDYGPTWIHPISYAISAIACLAAAWLFLLYRRRPTPAVS